MLRYWLIPLGTAIVLTLLLWRLQLHPLLAWCLAINFATLITFGFDKVIAGSSHTRVPEIVLLALTFIGGHVGAFLGMQFFRHKTLKSSFQLKFWAVTAVSLILTAVLILSSPLFR
ncbi:MAG: DUF1294 domain-containing protein [Anaerolineales bacterium]|nr:DUF1294 domain-containing protein [Anaerolineales bacterium]